MKNLITIFIMLVAVGCGKDKQPVNTYENKKRVGFLSHRTEAKPVKELTKEDVVGSYESFFEEDTTKLVLLENGKVETSFNGEKIDEETWKIVGKEIHSTSSDAGKSLTRVYKIEPNGDLTWIEWFVVGKREDRPKIEKETFKKLK